ncbi:hypothetical protein [Fontibacillus sp. BL9]|uniref:hypothetical protein n=1 Tax=Fontibacillus sp. BL9 TaxID=3389971 RepID=UPI003979E667
MAGNPAGQTKRAKLVSGTKEPEELNELVTNEINLNMLLRQYLDEIGYELFPGEVSLEVTMDEHVLKFWEFALSKGYDPRPLNIWNIGTVPKRIGSWKRGLAV